MSLSSKTTLKLNKALCRRAAECAEKAGYASLEEFVEHAIEKELAQSEAGGKKEDVVRKLKGLGYIE